LEGTGDVESISIGFTEDENCLYFDMLVIPGEYSWESDKNIVLTAKMDDLYWHTPNLPYDEAIGGKE